LVSSRLVSSTNKIDLNFPLIDIDKSFMWRRKSTGPKIDPCGTVCFMSPQTEKGIQLKFLLSPLFDASSLGMI